MKCSWPWVNFEDYFLFWGVFLSPASGSSSHNALIGTYLRTRGGPFANLRCSCVCVLSLSLSLSRVLWCSLLSDMSGPSWTPSSVAATQDIWLYLFLLEVLSRHQTSAIVALTSFVSSLTDQHTALPDLQKLKTVISRTLSFVLGERVNMNPFTSSWPGVKLYDL